MTEYNHKVQLNGSEYELNDSFRDALEERMLAEYEGNEIISIWWKEKEPTLVLETVGNLVPWDDLDQLDAEMVEMQQPFMMMAPDDDDEEPEEIDEGGGQMTLPPGIEKKDNDSNKDIFGRTHFGMTPHRFEEVPSPEGHDPEKLPPKAEKLDEESMVFWIPRHPDVEHTWSAGETVTEVSSWVEWDVQLRADQPDMEGQGNTHSRFESLCRLHNCEKVAEYQPSDRIPKKSGSVERKGEKAFDEGRFGGDNWDR